jgi:hypothetical protein
MTNKNVSVNTNPGWLGAVGVILVCAKIGLFHSVAPGADQVMEWSWWLVLLPFYGGLAILIALLALTGSGFGVVMLVAKMRNAYVSYKHRKEIERRKIWKALSDKDLPE